MGIRIKKHKDDYRPWWYANYRENGVLTEIRLDVKIEGKPPASLKTKDMGDARFERSRGKAQLAFEHFLENRQSKGASESIMERLIASKTGETPSYAKLSDLATLWNNIPRDKQLGDDRKRANELIFREFAESCGREFAYEVKPADVARYFNKIRGEYAWETAKTRMSLLTGAFARFLPNGMPNPFKAVMRRSGPEGGETISKVPLTDAQLRQMREYAKGDPFMYPLVECAICTGARIEDVCKMKWSNIDLADGFVTYRSSKTGALCEIPLFDEFRAVCEGLLATKDPSEEYLFPDAAYMYDTNRSGLSYRGKKLFAGALFGAVRNKPAPTEVIDGEPVQQKTPAEVLEMIAEHEYKPQQAERMKSVYYAYAVEGKSFRQIEQDTGISRSAIHYYLSLIEQYDGAGNIIRFNKGAPSIDKQIKEHTRVKRKVGKCSASIYGWHTFRATFCVLASLHGVPEKEIINAVGHTTYKTTMKYYNNPTRAHIKEVWKSRMAETAIGCTNPAVARPNNIKSFVASLTTEQQKAILSELTSQLLSA